MTRSSPGSEYAALADEYQAGLDKCMASGYEEYGPDFQRRHRMVIEALRLRASQCSAGTSDAVKAERERCIAICEGWIGSFQDREIQYTSAREYAVDAVEDIIDLIRDGQSPHPAQAVLDPAAKGPDDCAEYMLLQARRKGQEQWTNIYAAQIDQFVGYGYEVRALTLPSTDRGGK